MIGALVFAVAMATVVTVPTAEAAKPVGKVGAKALVAPSAAEVRAIHFRTSMGFNHDLNLVRGMEHVKGAAFPVMVSGRALVPADVSTELGVPLTLAELKEVKFRQTVIKDDGPLVKRLSKKVTGKEPAGVFMDNEHGGVLTVAVTGDDASVRKTLAVKVLHSDRLKVVKVSRSMDDLKVVAAGVHRDRELSPVPGAIIYALAIDEPRNQVEVDAEGDIAALQAYFDDRYGTGSTYIVLGKAEAVGAKSMSSTPFHTGIKVVNSPPFRGGQLIVGRLDSTRYQCTSGFVVWRGTASSKNYFMLTAGHCGSSFVHDIPWYQADSVAMGRGYKYDKSGTDAQLINIANGAAQWNSEITLKLGEYRTITSSQGQGADMVGQTSCITGMNYGGARCGKLLNTSKDFDDGDVSYVTGREIDAACDFGDSGGPAFYGNEARGTISVKLDRAGTANDTCIYTHIYDNLAAMGASMATSG